MIKKKIKSLWTERNKKKTEVRKIEIKTKRKRK